MIDNIFPWLILGLVTLTGCGQHVPAVTGGTQGILECEGQKIGDVQLTLYPGEGTATAPVGFAVTQLDGTFELYKMGATGPLWLPAGQYRCTLESVGAPVQIPSRYMKPETTPLTVDWTEGMDHLHIRGPDLTHHQKKLHQKKR